MNSGGAVTDRAENPEKLSSAEAPGAGRSDKSGFLLLLLPVALGLILRIATLGLRPVWDDEAWTYFASSGGWRHLLDTLTLDNHPLGFYLLEMLPLRLFGRAEWGLRIVSLVSGVALVGAAALVQSRLNGRWVGVATAALLSASPLLVYSSQEARSYSLLALFTIVGAWLLWQHVERPSWRVGAFASVVVLLASFTHYYGTFLLVFGAVAALLRPRKQLVAALAPVAVSFVGSLALLPVIITQKQSYAGVTFSGGGYGEDLGIVRSLARSALVIGNAGYPEGWLRPAGYALFILVSVGLLAAALANPRQRARCLFPGLLAVVLIACWQVGGCLHLWPIRDNYVAVIAPAVLMLLAQGLSALKPQWLRVTAFGALLAVMATGDLALAVGGGRRNPDYRAAVAWAAAQRPDGVMLTRSWGDLSCYKYYEKEPLPTAVYGLDPTRPGGVTFEARVCASEIRTPLAVLRTSRRVCLLGKDTGQAGVDAFQAQLRRAGYTQAAAKQFHQVNASIWVR